MEKKVATKNLSEVATTFWIDENFPIVSLCLSNTLFTIRS